MNNQAPRKENVPSRLPTGSISAESPSASNPIPFRGSITNFQDNDPIRKARASIAAAGAITIVSIEALHPANNQDTELETTSDQDKRETARRNIASTAIRKLAKAA